MTFNSFCLIPLLRIFRKSKVVPWMLFFLLETTHGVSKLNALVVQTRKTERRTISWFLIPLTTVQIFGCKIIVFAFQVIVSDCRWRISREMHKFKTSSYDRLLLAAVLCKWLSRAQFSTNFLTWRQFLSQLHQRQSFTSKLSWYICVSLLLILRFPL